MAKSGPVVLCILDGWGINPSREANAVALGATPNFDRILAECPHAQLAVTPLGGAFENGMDLAKRQPPEQGRVLPRFHPAFELRKPVYPAFASGGFSPVPPSAAGKASSNARPILPIIAGMPTSDMIAPACFSVIPS